MSEKDAHQRALELLEIDDIFVVANNARVIREFNQTFSPPEVRFQHRLIPDGEILVQERVTSADTKISVVRYFVSGGVRVMPPDGPDNLADDAPSENFQAEIHATLAVDYRCVREFRASEDEPLLSSFLKNAVFHAWPIWRAHVLSTAAQLRLPRIVVPMMRPLSSEVPSPQIAEGVGEATRAPQE